MTISIPSQAVFISSTASDTTPTFEEALIHGTSPDCWRSPITKNMEIREGDNIYIYVKDEMIYIPDFDSSQEYDIGQLVFSGCKIYRIANKLTIKGQPSVPLEPEQYSSHETELSDWESWTKRYYAHIAGEPINHHIGNFWYTISWYDCPNKCNGGGWLWTVHDQRDVCNNQSYFDSCMVETAKYDPSKDIKADKVSWGAPGQAKAPALKMKSMIHRAGYYYYRTWVDIEPEATPEVDDSNHYTLSEVKSPGEIDGFVKYRIVCEQAPFDNKNYTKCVDTPSSGVTKFIFESNRDFDTLALGRVIAESVSVTITNPDTGEILSTIDHYPIDNSIGKDDVFEQAVTVVLYTVGVLPKKTRITLSLNGSKTEIGTIKLGLSIDAGFTNTKFDNTYKDFSPKEQDQWGNITYKNGVRVFVYTGTVDMPTSYYDTINRLFMNIGAQEMIINGSDSLFNTPPNSLTIFQSSMLIGRITSFKQSTKQVGGIMDNIATYSFSIEESV